MCTSALYEQGRLTAEEGQQEKLTSVLGHLLMEQLSVLKSLDRLEIVSSR